MSRRHTTNRDHRWSSRDLGAALVMLVSLAIVLPSVTAAQEASSAGDATFTDQQVNQRWQLLSYRDAEDEIQTVPAGVGATLQLWAGNASGEAACSTFESSFNASAPPTIYIDPPTIARFTCDPASEAFDETFYQNLAATTSALVTDSIMTLRNEIDQELMTFTRAVIDQDPTVARWELARIGSADGTIEPVIQGLDPWLEFLRGGHVVGSTGCGSLLGSYQIFNGTMRITDVADRLEGCTESARRQAELMVETFSDITDFEVLPAGMSLEDEAGRTRLALVPAIDLAARTWTPIEILDANGDVTFDAASLATSTVKFQGRSTEGHTACGSFDGQGLSSGLALSTSELKLKGKPCAKKSPLRAVERAFLEALANTSSQALRGSELELKDVNGVTLMRLQPQADLVGTTWVVTHLNANLRGKSKQVEVVPDTVITATFDDFESVIGDTAAGSDYYTAGYRTPAASAIVIEDLYVNGTYCDGKRAQKRRLQTGRPVPRPTQTRRHLHPQRDRAATAARIAPAHLVRA